MRYSTIPRLALTFALYTINSAAAPARADDCNQNGVPDDQDIATSLNAECVLDGVPVECTPELRAITFDTPEVINERADFSFVAAGNIDPNQGDTMDLVLATPNATTGIALQLGDGTGAFSAGTGLRGQKDAHWIELADFNADDILDIASAHNFEDEIRIHLGDGDGGFTLAHSVVTPPIPVSLASDDLDNDGDIDLVAGFYSWRPIAIAMLNNGDGTFAPPIEFEVDANSYTVALGDVNGDDVPDFVFASWYGIGVRFGVGDGTFGPQTNYDYYINWVGHVALADFDGDGHLDAITADEDRDTLHTLFNKSDGSFGPANTHHAFNYPRFLAVADFDLDGDNDVIAANRDYAALSLHANPGDGAFEPASEIPLHAGAKNVIATDFDADGRPDLVALDGNHDIVTLRNVTAISFDCNLNGVPDECDITAGTSSDANGDGVPDECTLPRGDMNCDGVVDVFDIDPFVTALVAPEDYATRYPDCALGQADVNADDAVDFFDIDPFVTLLAGA
jgi:hypothetical protein